MNAEQIVQEATEAVTKGLPCAFLVPKLLEVIESQKAEIEILIRKKETLRDELAEKDAEIERLKAEIRNTDNILYSLDRPLAQIKSEAYREFAERLIDVAVGNWKHKVNVATIDNTLKELTEKNDFKE